MQDHFHGVTFTSAEVRERCAKAIALIEEAAARGNHGPLRLDGLMRAIMPAARRSARYIIRPNTNRRSMRPFVVVASGSPGTALRSFQTLDGALLHYPGATVTEEALERAGNGRKVNA